MLKFMYAKLAPSEQRRQRPRIWILRLIIRVSLT